MCGRHCAARVQLPPCLLGADPDTVAAIIRRANLGREDTEIARLRYIDQIPLAEIGAEIGLDRTSVGRRLARIDKKLKL